MYSIAYESHFTIFFPTALQLNKMPFMKIQGVELFLNYTLVERHSMDYDIWHQSF